MEEMTVEKLASAGVVTLPWPAAVNGVPRDDAKAPAHLLCKTCGNRECMVPLSSLTATGGVTAHICHMGVSYYKAQVGEEEITFYGVFNRDRDLDKKSQGIKRALSRKDQIVARAEVVQWVKGISFLQETMAGMVAEAEERAGREMRDMILHNAPAMVLRAKEALDKFMLDNPHGVAREIKAASKSVRMAADTFEVVVILLNPEAASYGKKWESDLYKLLDGVRRNSTDLNDRGVNILGNTDRKVNVYNNFNLLPLMLIQNAIKYNCGKRVFLKINEAVDNVEIVVESYGPMIEDAEKSRIFEKKFRGKWAKVYTSQKGAKVRRGKKWPDGRGWGLHVAQVIAKAHGTTINVESIPDGTIRDGVPMARNTFSFVLRDDQA